MGRNFSLIASTLALALALAAAVPPAGAETGDAEAPNLIAPPAVCENQTRPTAPYPVQVEAMRCMTGFARVRSGLESLAPESALDGSAQRKSRDVLRCDEFSHFACDREFTFWMERSGYLSTPCWRVGENLAWGVGREGTVRSIFRAWMRSPGHRVNILGEFEQLGLGLRVGRLEGESGVSLWTQHFGTQCGGDE